MSEADDEAASFISLPSYEMATLVAQKDWSQTALGPQSAWSPSLRMAVDIVMASGFPMALRWGPQFVLIYNDGYRPILGDKHPWALGRPASEAWAEVWPEIEPFHRQIITGESAAVFAADRLLRIQRHGDQWDDARFTLSYSPTRDDTVPSGIGGIFVTAIETTERVRAERQVLEAQEALRKLNETLEEKVKERTRERDRLWENTQDLMVVVGADGIFQAANPAWTRILGWAEDEVVGRHHLEFNHPDDHIPSEAALDRAISDVLPAYESRILHKDGSYRWISWVAASEGDLVFASGRHVTAEKAAAEELAQAQEALRQSQKMEAIGQLTGGVAHDFNNLLTIIRSSVDFLKRPDLDEERRARYVEAISETVSRAAKLTGQLLAFARRQALKPETFDAARSVMAISDMVRTLTGSRIQIVTDLAAAPCFVNADPAQFDTAIVNMAVNARDAMDGEGQLSVTVRTVSAIPAVRAHPELAGPFVAVSLEDTGSGIAADQIDHIFEPFFTTKAVGAGTGLGLSQVFGFAKQSGGEIRVESDPGRGTVFTLYLPQVSEAIPELHADQPVAPESGEGLCVLVVEDNEDVGAFATRALQELGHVTVWTADGAAALDALEHDADRFDVVFSDVIMPGMNGIDLAQEIRRRHRDLPVVLTSGYSHVLAKNGTHGFELLHKPYSVEELSGILGKAASWRRRERDGTAPPPGQGRT